MDHSDRDDGQFICFEALDVSSGGCDQRCQYFAGLDDAADARDAAAADDDLRADERDAALAEQDERVVAAHPSLRDYVEANAYGRRCADLERRRARRDRRAARVDRDAAASERAKASFDSLTGVYRRDAGFRRLGCALKAARHEGIAVTVGIVDVDGLKAINDRGGHNAGDAVLVSVATTLRRCLRANDPVVRYGGDEFVFAATGLEAADVVARMTRANRELYEACGATVSVGVVTTRGRDTLATLISRADTDLYRMRDARLRTSGGGRFHSIPASGDVIGQALGMFMERFDIAAVDAFTLLTTLSQDSNTGVGDLARSLVDADRRTAASTDRVGRPGAQP